MKHLDKNFSKWSLFLLTAIVGLLLVSPAMAQEGAQVYLQQVEGSTDALTVDVMADNVTNLYGAEFRLTYDPTMVAVQDFNPSQDGLQIEPGQLLPANKGFVVVNNVDEVQGTVTFALTLLNPAPAANGSGPLARVTFNKLQNGPHTITVDHAKLVAIDLQTIPSQTMALSITADNKTSLAETENQPLAVAPVAGNQPVPATADEQPVPVVVDEQSVPAVSNEQVAPNASNEQTGSVTPPTRTFPWWIVAVDVIFLGVLLMGAFMLMGGFINVNPESQPKQATAGPVGSRKTRPSAFEN